VSQIKPQSCGGYYFYGDEVCFNFIFKLNLWRGAGAP